MFDPNVYAQLAAIDPAAAANYLTTSTAVAAPPAAVPQATFQQPNLQQALQNGQAAAPQQIAARGTLEDFFNQPSGGGGPSVTSKFFKDHPQGSWLQMTVLADVTHADVQHQKTPQGVLQYFKKNGQDDLTRPKLVLVLKVQVTGSSDGSHPAVFPDGVASVWLKKGPVTDNLVRAMTAAGDPSGYPKGGAQMVMVSAGEQASRTVGYSATKLYDFQYAAPAGSVDLQAIAQAASGFPTQNGATAPAPGIAPVISVPPVTAAPAAPPTLSPAPAVNGASAIPAALSTPPAPAPVPTVTTTPTAAPVAAAPSLTAAPPVPPVPEVTDPKAAERAALLAQLQGLNA